MATKKILIACVVGADGSWNAVSWWAPSSVSGAEASWRDAAWEGYLGESEVKGFCWIEAEIPIPDAEAVVVGSAGPLEREEA